MTPYCFRCGSCAVVSYTVMSSIKQIGSPYANFVSDDD
jgi:hypothetical protein